MGRVQALLSTWPTRASRNSCYRGSMGHVQALPFSEGTAADQVAASEALWRRVAAGEQSATVRWYEYRAPALVLGISQDASVVDDAACRARGVAVVKRASGGTVVLVDRTAVALDVALPAAHPQASHDVVEAYRWLGEALASALRRVAPDAAERIVVVDAAAARADQQAARAAAAETPAALRQLACFGVLSPFEVALAAGMGGAGGAGALRKLVGLSQVRKRGVVLFQAGLYTRFTGARLAGLLGIPPEAKAALAAELDRRVAALDDLGLVGEHVPRLIDAFDREARVRL